MLKDNYSQDELAKHVAREDAIERAGQEFGATRT
jgi:hypothetical protein